MLYEYTGHTASVNSVAFAPEDPLNVGGAEEGLMLASGSSDGSIAVISTTGARRDALTRRERCGVRL